MRSVSDIPQRPPELKLESGGTIRRTDRYSAATVPTGDQLQSVLRCAPAAWIRGLARRRAGALALAFVAGFGLAGCLGQASPSHALASPVRFNRETYAYQSALSAPNEARRYSVMVLQATDARWVPILRRWNPRLKILVYQDIALSRATDGDGLTVCTGWRRDLVAEPAWFLKGPPGERISSGFNYLMDVGNRAYQRACVAHAIELAKRLRFNGIFLDGIAASFPFELPPNARSTSIKYPTVASWQAAMYSMLAYAGHALHAHKLSVVANIGGAVLTRGLWQRWNAPLDGAEEESWTDGGLGLAQQLPWWREKLANVAWSEAHHKYAILHSYNPSEAGNVFGLASMLLVAAGHASYSTSNVNVTSDEAWYPEYGAAQRLGGSAGRYTRLHNGVYERVFAHGLVLVNPTTHSVGRFSLGRRRYSGSGLRRAGVVSMGPISGLILTRAGRSR